MVLSEGLSLIRNIHRRSATDPSLTDDAIVQQWNMARREIWSDLSGSESQTLTLDIIAGEVNYPLDSWTPERVLGVSVKDATGLMARPLSRMSIATLLQIYPQYPDTNGELYPLIYQVRLWASVVGLKEIWDDPWGTSEQAQKRAYVINIWPAPTVSVQSGMHVEMVGASAPLSSTNTESQLPVEIDEAACYQAAVRLSLMLGYDPAVALWLPELRRQAEEMLNRAKRWRANFGGGLSRLVPQGFGGRTLHRFVEPYASAAATPTLAVAPAPVSTTTVFPGTSWKFVDKTPTVGANSVAFDLTALGLPTVHPDHLTECRIISQDMGEIFNVAVTGVTVVTGILRDGFTFDTGDTCRLWYPIES